MIAHLKSRGLNPEFYPGIIVTPKFTTFPLYNLVGQWVGYQQYNPTGSKQERCNPKLGKYFTYISKGALTAWGLELLNPRNRNLYILEGIFSACRFHNYGFNALAVLSNNPKHLHEWLHSLGYNIISICDGDSAGHKLGKYGHESIHLPTGKYIDEMSEQELQHFILTELTQEN